MENPDKYFETLYKNFNERRIDLVIANMATNVKWANGMEGGYVYGHGGVRDYWTRQFKIASSNVNPTAIKEENGVIIVTVHQVVHDLVGNLLSDELVEHIFYTDKDKIVEFNIR
ncbi:MAG: hypothetical protein ABI707_19380 [Ferruginibacter sp.]